MKKSPYQILGLSGNFNKNDIKRAYKRLIREFPPEQNSEKFSEIRDAYDALSSEEYMQSSFAHSAPLYEVELNIKKQEIDLDKLKYLKSMFETPFEIFEEIEKIKG